MCSITNRIRRVKCDENKPFCRRCVATGRTCDGYESPFRLLTSRRTNNACAGGIKSDKGLQPVHAVSTEITSQDVDLLNRYFSIKTVFDVRLGCDEEARQVLQASLRDPPIRHAVLSLRALRENFETSGDSPAPITEQSSNYNYGLQQYSMALGGLACNLSSPGSNGLKSILLCCQIFISIEQVREDYAAMALHLIRGLGIMHEYRARPGFVATNELVPANHDQLPFLDVFVVKLFAAPCKFTEAPATADASETTPSACSISPHQQPVESGNFRAIAPDMRAELTRIAASTLEFLGQVSQVESVGDALRLLSEKAALLESLESWLVDLELVQTQMGLAGPEPLAVSFMRLFHIILRVVLLGALDSSADLHTKLQTDHEQLQCVANNVGERVRAYRRCSGTISR